MMKKYCFRLLSITSKSLFLWILIGLELSFNYAFRDLFSFSVDKIMAVSGGFGLPDTKLYYSYGQLQNIFQHFGVAGRLMYLKLQWVDMVYPLIYSTLLASLLFMLIKKTRLENLVFLPFLAAVFDYMENVLLRINVLSFPIMDRVLVQLSAFATFLKWSLAFLSVLLIIGAAIRYLFSRLKRKTA